MRLASAVVLYNPEKTILDNIQTYLPFSDVLYVMDNSSQDLEFVDEIKKLTKVEYISMHGNQGIAAALKAATEKAIADGYDFLLTMDQDSQYPTEDFKIVKDYLTHVEPNVALISINYTGSDVETNSNDKKLIQRCYRCITSGTLINLNAYHNITGFNANFFIDFVDYDLCCQFLTKNYKLVIFPNIKLSHSLGRTQIIKFFWLKKERHIHSALRYYYMYRNYYFLKKHSSKEYKKQLKRYKKEFNFVDIMQKCMFRKDCFNILRMIRRGIRDGKNGILGLYKEICK